MAKSKSSGGLIVFLVIQGGKGADGKGEIGQDLDPKLDLSKET